MRSRKLNFIATASLLLAFAFGCHTTDPSDLPDTPGPSIKPGETEFVSADAYAGQTRDAADASAEGAAGSGAPTLDGESGGDPRAVAEGDIYRVLDKGTILNLNSFRGLQVIDVTDPDAPAVIGRLPLVGTPVEMYVRGDRAFILLNDWQGYYGTREDVAVTRREGGLLVVADISDRTAPTQLDTVLVEGQIKTSRLVFNDSVAALYVASSHWEYSNTESITKTIVTSFDASGAALVRKTELDLGGYVNDIQATPDTLLVAGTDWTYDTQQRSTVAVVDISDPSGKMALGDTITAAGQVTSQFNMDLYNGVLRVVSTAANGGQNQVQTFNATNLAELTPIDKCEFGDGQQLYATLFLQNKAFFVTYLRQDPFHAFELRDDGTCVEHNEYVVSGWNDFFRAVAGGTRLLGVGTDDADATRTPAVSLYDITDLDNTKPLLARANAGAFEWSWSEAASDHRAFSVLEDAVSVKAADGTEETGLVLLPYSGYIRSTDGKTDRYDVGVTLFTFSDHTVTRRANVAHDSDVRRTFLADDALAANLSETSLSLFDPTNPDEPKTHGKVELAPDYGRILRFGDYIARVKRPNYDYNTGLQTSGAIVQLVAADSDIDNAAPIASFEVPASAQFLKAGDLLVTIEQTYLRSTDGTTEAATYETLVTLHDLSDPTKPRAAGTAKTRDLKPTYFGYGAEYGDFRGGLGYATCGTGLGWFDGSQADGMFALGDALVFVDARGEQEVLGHEYRCNYYPLYNNACDDGECENAVEGHVECSKLDDGPELCNEQLARCDWTDYNRTCEPVEWDSVKDQLQKDCWDNESIRYWSRYSFKALDLSDADAPRFGKMVQLPRTEEGVSVLPSGDKLYFSFLTPSDPDAGGRPQVRYYFRELSFANVDAPKVSDPINVPGELLAVDGARAYTKDLRWTDSTAETYLHELSIEGGVATLEHSRDFIDRSVSKVVAESGELFIVHDPIYTWEQEASGTTPVERLTKLSILAQRGLEKLGETSIDSWSSLQAVHNGRALFNVPGGLLMTNVEDPTAPYAQAFFYTTGWPEQILFERNEVLIAAGRYGIQRFDATDTNLLED